MSTLSTFAHAHWHAALYTLGVWFAVGNALARKWPIPPATAPKWKRVLHFVLVNLPQMGKALQGRTVLGFKFDIPLFSFTLRTPDEDVGAVPPPPPNGQSGRTRVDVLLWLAMLAGLCGVAFAGSGCGTAQMTTMKAEYALGSAVSLCYRTIDGVDQIVTDKIRVEDLNGDHDKAVQAYADYKPRIEKARAGCNTGADVYDNVGKIQQAAAKVNDWKQFNTWLPVLLQAASDIATVVNDIKGLVQ